MPAATPLRLLAGRSSSGRPAYEEVLAEWVDGNRYRLIKSPGLVLGVAAGDEIELCDNESFRVLRRAGNVCVQLFSSDPDLLQQCERHLTPLLRALGGWLDGRAEKELVFTIPAEVGFRPIEQALGGASQLFKGIEWYYGNVYDPVDGVTPLNWW